MIQEANLHWRYIDTESNLIMPWYTLPALQWLKAQDTKSWDVFEYGAGYSTIWWRLNCNFVKTVESNEHWAKALDTWYSKGAAYPTSIRKFDEMDCIIIDGDQREECVKVCIHYLKSGGILIIDNYGQEDFPPDAVERTEKLLQHWGKEIHKQPNHTEWTTAIFQKP